MPDDPRILLCYDGSDEAIEAIDFAARLCGGGTRATVLYAWEASPRVTTAEWAPVAIPPDPDQEEERRARRLAEVGARHARDRGLDAEAYIEEAMASPWRTIVEVADGEYDLIVMGTRGLAGLRSLVLGGTSHHVAQHAACPVLIVPAAALAEVRRKLAQPNGHAGR